MGRRRLRAQLSSVVYPDITSLCDLTFILLLVFIITRPMMEHSLDVSPPQLNAKPIDPKEYVVVNIDRDGTLFLDSNRVGPDELSRAVMDKNSRSKALQIFIRADKSRPYGEVIGVMRLIQDTGITDVSLVTEAEDETP